MIPWDPPNLPGDTAGNLHEAWVESSLGLDNRVGGMVFGLVGGASAVMVMGLGIAAALTNGQNLEIGLEYGLLHEALPLGLLGAGGVLGFMPEIVTGIVGGALNISSEAVSIIPQVGKSILRTGSQINEYRRTRKI